MTSIIYQPVSKKHKLEYVEGKKVLYIGKNYIMICPGPGFTNIYTFTLKEAFLFPTINKKFQLELSAKVTILSLISDLSDSDGIVNLFDFLMSLDNDDLQDQ